VIVSSWAIRPLLPLLQVEGGEVLHEGTMDEDVTTTNAPQENTVVAVVQESDIVEGHRAVKEKE
jgi:hypothetical protein